MQIEKGHDKLSCMEFLLSFQRADIIAKNESELDRDYPLEIGWRDKVHGRRVVCFALSGAVLRGVEDVPHKVIMWMVTFIRNTFRQARDVLFWWLDDGMLEMALESYKGGQEDEGKRKQADYDYKIFLQEFHEDAKAIHDKTGNILRSVAWSDAYYGDDCPLADSFRVAGKPLYLQDMYRQNIMYGRYAFLENWLDMINHPKVDISVWTEPSNWQEASCGRKVILYHISAEALLNEGEVAIDKLERVVKMAKARTNLCFYWLVNSDIEVALALLGSRLEKRYQECVKSFISGINCCFDRMSELTVAMKHADVYYGDDVTCLDEYIKQGKPVVYQSYIIRPERYHIIPHLQGETFGLCFRSGVWVGDFYYFIAWYGNGLFRLRRGNDRGEFVSVLPSQKTKKRNCLYAAIIYDDGKLYLIPSIANEIQVFDIASTTWDKSISVSRKYALDSDYSFSGAYRQGDILWLLPLNYYAVGKFNLKTRELTYVDDWGDMVAKKIYNPSSQHFSNWVLSGGCICFAVTQANVIIQLDMQTGSTKIHELDLVGQGIYSLAFDEVRNKIWIVDKEKVLFSWSLHSSVRKHLKLDISCILIYHSDTIWAISTDSDSYLKYDILTGQTSFREHYLPAKFRPGLRSIELQKDDCYIYILPYCSEVMARLNPVTEEVDVYTIRLADRDKEVYMEAQFGTNVLPESDFIDENEMATWFETCKAEDKNIEEIAGVKIYNAIIHVQ